jgi:hypothetical protein
VTRPNLTPVTDGPELPAGPFELPVGGAGLTIPRLRVVPASGEAYEVQAYNPDLLLFEDTQAKHRWPGPSAAPFRWLTFLAWAASRRTGRIEASVTWDEFRASTLQVESLNTPDATATPTRPGPEPG